MRLPALLLTLLAISALTALGCGGGDDEDSTSSDSAATTETTGGGNGGGDTGKGGTVSISADPSGAFAYAETEVSAPTGAVEVDFENESGTDHDVVIEDGDGNEIARTDVHLQRLDLDHRRPHGRRVQVLLLGRRPSNTRSTKQAT